jgi:ATP-dependent exoDNAse (exonuclease V) beta subunit
MAVPISVPERSLQVILETLSMAKSAGVIHALWNWIHQLGILSREAGQAGAGDFEAQIWKFFGLLEVALSTEASTVLEFLDSMSALETDHMVMPARVQDAVTVMTVHKSKGLEFPHVILPFFDHRFRSVSRKYEIHESNNAWSIGVMVPGDDKRTHVFLSECDKAANAKMAKEEALRLIYVAFTRAEESLTLVVRGPPSKDMRLRSQIDQADPQSVIEGLHNGVLFLQNGEQIKDLLTQNLADRGNGENELGEYGIGKIDFQESKMSQWRVKTSTPDSGSLPPSQIHQEKGSQALLNRSSVLESFQRAERGIQIHRLFESIRHSGFRKIQEGASALERRLLEYIRGCDVIPLLRAAERGWVEWAYEYRTQAADVNRGQIDLFWIENEILYIVDYKTGSSHFRDSAFAQMREYARALQTIFPLHPIFKNHRIEQAFLCAVYPFEESTFIQEFMEWKKS